MREKELKAPLLCFAWRGLVLHVTIPTKLIIYLAVITNSNNLIIRYRGVFILYKDIILAYINNKKWNYLLYSTDTLNFYKPFIIT